MRRAAKVRIVVAVVAAVILSAITSFLAFNKPTNASADTLGKKWFLADHYNCIVWSASNEINVSGTIDTRNSWSTIEDLMYKNPGASQPTPNYGYLGVSGDITCRDVLDGTSSMKGYNGVLNNIGLAPKTGFDQVTENQMKSLGYTPKAADVIMISKKAWSTNNILGVKLEDPGYLKVNSGPNNSLSYSIEDEGDLELNLTGNQLNIDYEFSISDVRGYDLTAPFFTLIPWTCTESSDSGNVSVGLPSNGSVADAVNAINQKVGSIKAWVQRCVRGAVDLSGLVTEEHEVNEGLEASVSNSEGYTLGDKKAAADQSISRLLGNGNTSNLQPTEDEYYDLYYYYLKNSVFGGKDNPLSDGSLSCTGGDGYTEIHLKAEDGKYHRYFINNNKKTNDDFQNLIVNGDGFPAFFKVKIDDIIGWFRDYHQVEVEDAAGSCPAPAGTEQNNGDKNAEDSCFNAAESLGWIICPIVKGIGSAIDEFYKNVVEDLIQINVSAFDQSQGAYQAWQLFQSFANIVFVIMFLVVIISQLTGIGIDNLGIKRILPKLIIAAILVNLSFIICMLLVDAANIIGSGLYRLFDGVTFNNEVVGSSSRGAVTTLLSGLGLGAAIGAGAVAAFWIPGTIPAILLGLVGILISIIVMFVLLGVYQAGVILAVVISPIAFVMYMLPNTKNIFDRWRKLFQALLLLYPLCGLIMGGANFASKVLKSVSGDSFWMSLLAALLSVIPVFFIPTLLKGSLNAMGNIGAKISGLGKGLSGKTKGAISSSEAYQDMMARRAAGLKGDGKTLSWRGRRLESLSQKDNVIGRAAKRRWARGIASYEKRQEELNKAQKFTDPTRRQAHELSLEKALEKEGLANEMIVINNGTRNGDNEGELYRMFDEARDNGNITRMRAIAEIAGRRKDSASRFAEKLKRDTIEGKYAGEGGEDMLRDLSKQIATGDNSKNYREGNATGFEFAARTNDGSNSDLNYADWISNDKNVNKVVENYLNTPEGLSGQTKAVLKELSGSPVEDKQGNVLYTANINNKTKAALSRTADKYYQNHKSGNGVYYDDKEEHMQTLRGLSGNNSQSQSVTPNPNRAQPNQSFNVHNSSSDTQSSIVTPGTKEYNQAADNLKKNNS